MFSQTAKKMQGACEFSSNSEIAMFGKTWFRGFMAAIAFGIGAGFFLAQAAQAGSLRIENKRDVALKELRITAKDGAGGSSFVLASDLEARSQTNAKIPPGQCLFDVTGFFCRRLAIRCA